MRALVLSGGGSHGAFQAGVLKRLMLEQGNDYDMMCGISVGAINSAFLCQTPLGKPQEAAQALLGMWSHVSNDHVKKRWFPLGMVEALWKQSVYDSSALQKWIASELKEDAIKASGRQLRVVAVSWDTGESRVVSEKDADIAKWVIGSSSFPVFLSPITVDGQLWTDGGLRSTTPLGEAIKAGATDIDIVLCSNPFAPAPFVSKGKAAVPSLAFRAINIVSDEVSRADLRIAGLKNDLSELKPEFRRVKMRVFQPTQEISIDSLDFSQAGVQQMIQMGYDASIGPAQVL